VSDWLRVIGLALILVVVFYAKKVVLTCLRCVGGKLIPTNHQMRWTRVGIARIRMSLDMTLSSYSIKYSSKPCYISFTLFVSPLAAVRE
jgi:hypothetical protein